MFSRIAVALVALLAANIAVAALIIDVNGEVLGPTYFSGGPVFGGPCSYSKEVIGKSSFFSSCAATTTLPDAEVQSGTSSASANSGGLHATAYQQLRLLGEFAHLPPGSGIVATAESDASVATTDYLHFTGALPVSGYVHASFSAIGGSTGGGARSEGGAQSFLILSNPANSQSAASCSLSQSGVCSIMMPINFDSTLELDDNLFVFAMANVHVGQPVSAVLTNYSDTAFISELSFFDQSGLPVDVAYSSDSGYIYPMSERVLQQVDEPQTLALLGVALLILLALRKRLLGFQ